MPEYQDILYETRGAVARVTINRADRLNALALPATRDELCHVFDHINSDAEIRAVILTGAGERAFSTGWDMESIPTSNLAELETVIRDNLGLFFRIWNLRQPVIAAINGYAVAAGATLAMVCDMAIAAEHAQLGEPEIRHYALSPLLILPFLTHSKALHEYYYTGDMIEAQEMYRLGLVNRVVPPADLEASAWRMAERLAKVPSYPLQMTKRSLRAAYDLMGFSAAVRQHSLADTLVIGANLPEQQALLDLLAADGMRAFLAARDGPFKEPPQDKEP
jgi:enoyl-CoA hydratase/carnithine racemase